MSAVTFKSLICNIILFSYVYYVCYNKAGVGGCGNKQMYLDTTDICIQGLIVMMNSGGITASQDFMLTSKWSPPVNWNSPGQ